MASEGHEAHQPMDVVDSAAAATAAVTLEEQPKRKPSALEMKFSHLQRLIYRNMKYLEAKLEITTPLLDLIKEKKLFPPDELAMLYSVLDSHRDDPTPCRAVNEQLVTTVLRHCQDKHVDPFLRCLESHQKEIPLRILGGKTLKEITSGSLSGGIVPGTMSETMDDLDSSGGSVSLSHSGSLSIGSAGAAKDVGAAVDASQPSSPIGVDYDEFPEPDIAFEELFPDLEEPMPPDDAEEEWPKKYDIGPGGGTFRECDGAVSVSIPRDALDTVHKVSVMEAPIEEHHKTPDGDVYLGKALWFGEHGLTFKRPVRVEVQDAKLKPGDKVHLFVSDKDEDQLPEFLDITESGNICVDYDKKTISFQVDHFSYFLWAISAAPVTAMAVGLLLQSREVRVQVLAMPVANPETATEVRLQIILKPPGFESKGTRASADYHPVSESRLHKTLQLAPFERYVHMTLVSATDEHDERELDWTLTPDAAEKLDEGLQCPDNVRPVILQKKSPVASDHVAFPFEAALECHGTWITKKVYVYFVIDPAELLKAKSGLDRSQLAAAELPKPLPPPPQCPADHSKEARSTMMSKARKTALVKTLVALMNHTHRSSFDVLVPQLLRCQLFAHHSDDDSMLSGASGGTAQNKMRHLVDLVSRKWNSAFDCFCHALECGLHLPHLACALRKEEKAALESSTSSGD